MHLCKVECFLLWNLMHKLLSLLSINSTLFAPLRRCPYEILHNCCLSGFVLCQLLSRRWSVLPVSLCRPKFPQNMHKLMQQCHIFLHIADRMRCMAVVLCDEAEVCNIRHMHNDNFAITCRSQWRTSSVRRLRQSSCKPHRQYSIDSWHLHSTPHRYLPIAPLRRSVRRIRWNIPPHLVEDL